jgi:hypothetical protein
MSAKVKRHLLESPRNVLSGTREYIQLYKQIDKIVNTPNAGIYCLAIRRGEKSKDA